MTFEFKKHYFYLSRKKSIFTKQKRSSYNFCKLYREEEPELKKTDGKEHIRASEENKGYCVVCRISFKSRIY